MKSFLRTWLLATIAILLSASLWAQNQKKVTVKAGNRIADILSRGDIYYFPQFTSGKVFFKDGTKAEAKLNYSHLVDEMQFIDSKNDTLSLVDENTIKFIAVDKDTFFYNNGYQRLILQVGGIKLTQKQVWTLGDVRKVGAFNQTNTATGIATMGTVEGKGGSYNLVPNEDVDLRKVEQFFFADPYNQFGLASKKHLLELFPKKEQTIKAYLKESKVDFTRRDDLEKLAWFLANLKN